MRRYLFPLLAGVLIFAGCDSSAAANRAELRGLVLETPIEKPDFIFPATDGRAYNFREETDGDLALIFFGYANCPDICPVHMSNISSVLRKMSPADVQRVHLIFVTTDPERDTPEKLGAWLASIDASIVGLIPGPVEAIRVQSLMGVQPAIRMEAKPGHEGNYEVGHGAQVIAFTPDNRGRVVYPFGTLQTDWAHDIPVLLARTWEK